MMSAKILFALGLVENAYDDTAIIQSFTPDEIYDLEPALLEQGKSLDAPADVRPVRYLDHRRDRQAYQRRRHGSQYHGAICGKNLSGKPDVLRILVLDIAKESHGNGTGIGYADMTPQRVADKFDREQAYPNGLTNQVMV